MISMSLMMLPAFTAQYESIVTNPYLTQEAREDLLVKLRAWGDSLIEEDKRMIAAWEVDIQMRKAAKNPMFKRRLTAFERLKKWCCK